ncbi:MAG: hypothetical protein ACREI9_04245 [Nitrospiraceae bacterium]
MDTKVAPYPEGVTLVAPTALERKARQAVVTHEEITKDLVKVGRLKAFFKMSEVGVLIKIVQKRAKALTRAVELAKEFRMVHLDTTIKRKILVTPRFDEPKEIAFPFIFSSKLPAKTKTRFTVTVAPRTEPQQGNLVRRFPIRRRRRWMNPNRPLRYTVSAVTPLPPDGAIDALQKHGGKFDHTEVWWVPKDVVVKEVEQRVADPIVVGVIEAPRKNQEPERFCFELFRWEQPDIEKPYFAHEAY